MITEDVMQLSQQGVRLTLNLLAVLTVGGSWLCDTSNVWAQEETIQLSDNADEVTMSQADFEQTTASELLEQLQIAANSLQEDKYRKSVLKSIAQSYVELSEDAIAAEIVRQILTNNNDAETQMFNVYQVLDIVGALSDEALVAELLAHSLAITQLGQTDEYKIFSLPVIVEIASRLSDQAMANELLRQAIVISQSMPASDYKARLLARAAAFYISISDEATALDLLNQALLVIDASDDTNDSKYYVLSEVFEQATKLTNNTAKIKVLNQALTVFQDNQNQDFRAYALIQTAVFANEISDLFKANALIVEALSLTESMPPGWERSRLFTFISEIYAKHLFNERNAEDFFIRLLKATAPKENERGWISGLFDVVDDIRQLSNQTIRDELLSQVLAIVDDLEDREERKRGLLLLTEVNRALSKEADARTTLLQVLAVAEQLEDPFYRGLALNQFVLLASKFENQAIVRDLHSQALAYARTQQDASVLGITLIALAVDEKIPANISLERLAQVLVLMDEFPDQETKTEFLFHTMNVLHHLMLEATTPPNGDQVQTLLEQILIRMPDTERPDVMSLMFTVIAHVAGHLPTDNANAIIDQLLTIAQTIQTPHEQTHALGAIAGIYIEQSNPIAAQEILWQALAAVRQIEDEGNRFVALYTLNEMIGKLSSDVDRQALLREQLAIIAAMESAHYKTSGFYEILTTVYKSSDQEIIKSLFAETIAIADTIPVEDEERKAYALSTMAQTVKWRWQELYPEP